MYENDDAIIAKEAWDKLERIRQELIHLTGSLWTKETNTQADRLLKTYFEKR